MGRASGRPTRHDPFGQQLYLHTIIMVIVSVATTLFAILLLFSPLMPAPPRHPILDEGVGACASSPYSSTPAPTLTRTVAIARPRGRFTACAHHRFCHRQTSHSSSMASPYSSSPTCCPHPRSQPRADRRSSMRVRGELILLLAFFRACR
jgi:hypothetical protein